MRPSQTVKENVWVPTVCRMCYTGCSVLVNRVDGVARRIRGNPNSPVNCGKMCTRGAAALMTLYDPNRVKTPLKRTNPEKGIGVDPKWMEISWEEALNTVAERLKKVREKDPHGFVVTILDHNLTSLNAIWMKAFGTPYRFAGGGGAYCGGAQHPVCAWVHGSFVQYADLDYCNYLILMGTQQYSSSRMFAPAGLSSMTKARARGMKLVVIDPMCNMGADKADEWIPIRPGTDGALALAMVNVLLNELGICDINFIKNYTNLPYLIGPDGFYVRDKETGKPLIWDSVDSKAKPWDSTDIKDLALEGTFDIGVEAKPAFQIFKEHVKTYTPEKVSDITTIPAGTIRRIAQEFGGAARVGSTIVIDGKELPYRPSAVLWGRGAQGHKHSLHQGMAMEALPIIVGAVDVPGAIYGGNSVGTNWGPSQDEDGILVGSNLVYRGRPAYPLNPVKTPESLDLAELFPISFDSHPMLLINQRNPEKFKVPHKCEAMLIYFNNPMMNMGKPEEVAEYLRSIPFIAAHALFIDESVEFADIVFPDTFYLERYDLFPNLFAGGTSSTLGPTFLQIRQPVVKPRFDARPYNFMMFELADRIGFLPDFHRAWNQMMRLQEPNVLDPSNRYSFEEVMDITLKSRFGTEHDLEWFKKNGFITIPKTVEQVYWRPFHKGRIPFYMEFLKQPGEQIKRITSELGIDWDTSGFQPLIEWKPCPAYEEKRSQFDLYLVFYKAYMDTFGSTQENPILSELAARNPWTQDIVINPQTARKKGLKDGDTVTIESMYGSKVKGKVSLTEGIHPEVIGIASFYGQWAKGKPIARGKGTHVDALFPINMERIDWVSCNLDTCTKVCITKN